MYIHHPGLQHLGTRPDGICDAAIKEAKESLGYNSISESEHEGTEMDHERSPVIDATQGLNATGGLISSDSVSDESNPCACAIFAENGAIEDDNERENHVTFEDTADVSVLDDDNSLGDNNMADKSVLAKSAQKMRRFLHVASTPVRYAIRYVAPRKGKETIEERNRGSLHEWKPHDQCSRYKRTEYKETNADKANSLLHALSEKDPLRAAQILHGVFNLDTNAFLKDASIDELTRHLCQKKENQKDFQTVIQNIIDGSNGRLTASNL